MKGWVGIDQAPADVTIRVEKIHDQVYAPNPDLFYRDARFRAQLQTRPIMTDDIPAHPDAVARRRRCSRRRTREQFPWKG